jgi:protein SCO1
MTKSLRTAALVAASVLIALAATACGLFGGDAEPAEPAEPARYMGAVIMPPIQKPHAVLLNEEGEEWDLTAETEGYVTLLYVGYTHCPDICPTHLHEMDVALRQMDPAVASRVKVVMATADPERDSPEQLKQYLDTFNEEFIGLTGPRELMDQFQMALGLPPATRTDLGDGYYAVNHAAYVMAFTTDNIAHLVYPAGMGMAEWLNDLPLLVEKGYDPE